MASATRSRSVYSSAAVTASMRATTVAVSGGRAYTDGRNTGMIPAIMLKPALPFAAESRKIERSSRLYAVLFLGSMMAGIIPVFLPSVYARPPLTATVVALMLAVTAALEYTLRLRVAEAIGDLEFRE